MSLLTSNSRVLGPLLCATALAMVTGCSWTDTRPTSSGSVSSIGNSSYDDSGIPDVIPKVEPQTGAGNPSKYKVFGKNYRVMTNEQARGYKKRGKASWYGEKFHGRKTSNGEIYDMYAVTAAHKSLRIPCYVQVTHLKNGRSIVVRVNDRGPFVGDRIIDLSYGAATKLGMVKEGVADVEIALIDPNNYVAPLPRTQVAAASPTTTIDFARIPTATTYPVDTPVTPVPSNVQFIGKPAVTPELIGDISALPQSQPVQSANSAVASDVVSDAGQFATATPQPAGNYGDVQYRVEANGELVAEDFTEVYIEENQIAEYEQLNPAPEQTSAIISTPEVTEVSFAGSRQIDAKPIEQSTLPTPVEVEAMAPTAPAPTPVAVQPDSTKNITIANDGGLPFYVQVATFGNNDNAVNLAEKLADQQFTPVRLVAGEFGGRTLQQVRIGPFNSAQQAKAQQAALINAGYPRCFVVRSRL